MKNLLFILALCCTVIFQACDSSGSRPENKTSVDQVDPGDRQSSNLNDAGLDGEAGNSGEAAYGAGFAYVCPMKCEGSASNEPGKCPVCKMDLVKNANNPPGTQARQGEVLNHESEQADDRNMDDKIEPQPTR